ncbi:MAG TPA: cupredoxin domain-containing protein [Sphingomicrobium sp.]
MRLLAPSIALAVLLLSLPPAMAAPRTHLVVIDKMKFGAMPTGVRAGDRITWVNKDMFRHTATAKGGGFDVDLQPGAKATVVVRKAGAISVICRYHPGMKAVLKVSA